MHLSLNSIRSERSCLNRILLLVFASRAVVRGAAIYAFGPKSGP